MQNKLARTHRDNPLVQHRGQPSTHDVDLGKELFDRLSRRERNVKIPIYDKSAHGGKGDRRPQAEWTVVNRECEATIDVVIFEGWCVAFRPLSESDLRDKWWAAKTAYQNDSVGYQGQLGRLEFEHVRFINSALQGYDVLTNRLQALIHLYDITSTFCNPPMANRLPKGMQIIPSMCIRGACSKRPRCEKPRGLA